MVRNDTHLAVLGRLLGMTQKLLQGSIYINLQQTQKLLNSYDQFPSINLQQTWHKSRE